MDRNTHFVSVLTGTPIEVVTDGTLYERAQRRGTDGSAATETLLVGKAVYDWSEQPGHE